MRRRTLLSGLAGASVVGATGLAGCLRAIDARESGVPTPPPTVADRPGEVYLPTHAPGADHVATARVGDYAVGVLAGPPVRFWTVTGGRTEVHDPGPDRDVHLMATAWDPESGTVLPESGTTLSVRGEDDSLGTEVVYPMIGQRSGFHFGDNFALAGAGTYEVTVEVAPLGIRRTGGLRGRFSAGGTHAVEFAFDPTDLGGSGRSLDGAGSPGAAGLDDAGPVPVGRAPAPDALPGRVVAETSLDGARYVVAALDDPPPGVDAADGSYLAVSVRTPYNRLTVPIAGLSLDLRREGESVAAGRTERTVDPDLGYHYGLVVPGVQPGDSLGIAVDVPPQVGRHEGYETAFLGTPGTTVELS